jgi:hypothetical protein
MRVRQQVSVEAGDEWEGWYGVVQIATPGSVDQSRLRFWHCAEAEVVDRPLIGSCVSMFSSGLKYRLSRGVRRTVSATLAVTSHARPHDSHITSGGCRPDGGGRRDNGGAGLHVRGHRRQRLHSRQQDERYYRGDPELDYMDSSDESSTSERGRRSKVARLLEEYELRDLGDELEQMWTAETDRRSLRELADYFNQHLLQRKLEGANAQPLDGEVENIYRLLTADTVSGAEQTRVQRQLERDGIDVDALQSDFVTYQAIRTYLKAYRGAEYTPANKDPLERERQNLQQLRGRTVAVTEGKIEQLRDSDDLVLGEFRTLVNIQIVCEECNTQLAVFDLLERGGCDCSDE